MAMLREAMVKVLLLAVAMACAGGAKAVAGPPICRQLEMQLAALSRHRRDPALATRYSGAIEAQTAQWRITRSMASRNGCTGAAAARKTGADPRCGLILDTLARMKRNLAVLERQRGILAGHAATERQALQAALRANGCFGQRRTSIVSAGGQPTIKAADTVAMAQPSGIGQATGTFDETLPGGIIVHRPTASDSGGGLTGAPDASDAAAIATVPPGTYSTLCVRTCDGFYFPISYATTPANFATDERICQARCPGTDVHLYYHRVEGEESEDMVSLTGQPYKDLPNAFLYRKVGVARTSACGCANADYSATESQPAIPDASSGNILKQEPGHPDVLTFGAAEVPVKPAMTPLPKLVTPPSDGKRKVRIVGPQFFPDPSTAIDLQAPARTPDR